MGHAWGAEDEYHPDAYESPVKQYGYMLGVNANSEYNNGLGYFDGAGEGIEALRDVVMIQCVGSRNEESPNCSRVCCQAAVKNALRIKELKPDANVYVLYRDIRTYGELEYFYREARRQGVLFLRFDDEDPPQVESTEEKLVVTYSDPVLQRKVNHHYPPVPY